jgi:hypothetical protein
MTRIETRAADISELKRVYRDAAAKHGEATERADHHVANEMADLVAEIYAELRSRGSDAQRELLGLLADEAASVRLWAATHALEFAPEDGEPVLRSLVSMGRLLGFTADMTLTEWRAGRLTFP